jgi:hypothetical protein
MKHKVNETAAAGSVGAHAIAVAPSRVGATKKRDFKSFLVSFYDGLGNKLRMHPVNLYKLEPNKKVKVVSSVNENFNLDSVLAQLSNFENKTNATEEDVVSYGVEDDKGNLMKVTILNTQAEDFEAYISAYLSELKNFENSGVDLEDISLAELLYKLKDLFDIRDVEFPNISEDVVYNADEVSDSVEDLQQADEFGDEDMGEFGDEEFGDEDMGEFGDEGFDEGEFEGEDFGDEELGDEEFGEEGFEDDESVEDFEEFEDESDTQSLLNSIIDMLKTQAEEQKARYEADAERYRADQAEFSARAAEAKLADAEEMIAMQAEKDKQKQQEKEAKKHADLATYRYKRSRGMLDDANPTFEGFDDDSLLMDAVLNEEDIVIDPSLLRREYMVERRKIMDAINNAENDEEKKALQKQLQLLPRKYMIKRQEAEARGEQKDAQRLDNNREEEEQNNQNRPQDPRAQQQQAQSGQYMESSEYIIETISEEEYEKLEEGAKRQFKRYGNKFVRKFRCYGGPKDGRMVSKAADCGIRKDPFKVRQGKRSARRKKGQRVRKTRLTKRKAPSQRVTRMNKILRGDKKG